MIRAKHIKSIEELITAVKTDYSNWNTTTYPWFRGEPGGVLSPLLPKLYRKNKDKKNP